MPLWLSEEGVGGLPGRGWNDGRGQILKCFISHIDLLSAWVEADGPPATVFAWPQGGCSRVFSLQSSKRLSRCLTGRRLER